MLRTFHLVALAALLASASLAQSNLSSFWGSSANLRVGTSIDEMGDMNGDGYTDLVVGAPNPGGVGAVYYVSGKYLATGSGVSTLGATFAPVSGDLFGSAVLNIGDVTGDGVNDLLVGEPGSGAPIDGWAHLVNGATKSIVIGMYRADSTFGQSLARCGDVDGDGYTDAMVGCPSAASGGPSVSIVSLRKLFLGSPVAQWLLKSISGGASGFGLGLSAGDVDGDGQIEYVVGSWNSAAIYIYEHQPQGAPQVRAVTFTFGSAFGAAIDATQDFDHDGNDDIVVGAPLAAYAFALSGAMVFAGPTTQIASAVDLASWTNGQSGSGFGYSVAVTPTFTADFSPDIVVGAPWYDTQVPLGTDRGAVYFYSGDTLTQVGRALGGNGEQLGYCVSRAGSYDNLWGFEIAAGGPYSNHSASDGGIARIFSLFPATPTTYCTGKLNSLGCTPAMSYSGTPSLSSSSAFNVRAINVINNKSGILFYGLFPNSTAFQGGTLCVKSPTKRTPVQQSGGSASGDDCTGAFSYDFNALIQSGTDPNLGLYGQEVFCQYWSRDAASPSTTSLSNGLTLVINP